MKNTKNIRSLINILLVCAAPLSFAGPIDTILLGAQGSGSTTASVSGNVYVFNNTQQSITYDVNSTGNPVGKQFTLTPGAICELNSAADNNSDSPDAWYTSDSTTRWSPIDDVNINSLTDVTNNVTDGIYLTGNFNIDLCSNEGSTQCAGNNDGTYRFSLGVIYHGDISGSERRNRPVDMWRNIYYSNNVFWTGYFVNSDKASSNGWNEIYWRHIWDTTQTDFIFVENNTPKGTPQPDPKTYSINLSNITNQVPCSQ